MKSKLCGTCAILLLDNGCSSVAVNQIMFVNTLSYLCCHTTPIHCHITPIHCHTTPLHCHTTPHHHITWRKPVKTFILLTTQTEHIEVLMRSKHNLENNKVHNHFNFCRTIQEVFCTLLAQRYCWQCTLFWVRSKNLIVH